MIAAVFVFLYPVIHFLGTLCLMALIAAGVLWVVFRLVSVLWKPVLFLSSCIVTIVFAVLIIAVLV